MKTITKIFKTAMVLCLGLTITALNAQTTHIVNNNAGTAADFDNLQAAIDAAANGDIIHVQQSSTSYGNVTLDKQLTIIGRSHSDASYSSDIGTLELVEGSSNSVIKGLDISSVSEPFVSGGNYGTITDLVFQDNKIGNFPNIGIYRTFNNILMQGNIIGSFSIGTNTSNFLVTNNIFTSSSVSFSMVDTLLFANNIVGYFNGFSITNNTPDLLNISNCLFIGDRFADITVSYFGTGPLQITNCLTYNYDANYNFATGSNITISNSQENIDPLFTFRDGSNGSIGTSGTFNPNLDDLTLQAGSPFINDGIYEAYNFKPLGTPTGLPSLKIDSYDPTVPKNSDLTVTITAKTN
ncbi:hypothetical protein J4050_05775 [Winogradskyella sp. DF17]|uniref:Right handed beta helix domain-containing protein n=1 Tax=Winogradskyella pelagia TaxID=2819984 RepID=A0ABS3T0I0_9FLAO|nr:hypothetical protein [Winogradskyella sp. DF17]MBO3116247.1 hypothetical protein [Winogradskyella sp. DF17]